MDCKKIKGIIPKYVNHSATEDEISAVEEHLCVCHECRQYLSNLFDRNDSGNVDTGHITDKEHLRKTDIINISTIIIGIITVLISVWLFIKAQ